MFELQLAGFYFVVLGVVSAAAALAVTVSWKACDWLAKRKG